MQASVDAGVGEQATDTPKIYTEEELNAISVTKIKEIAAERGYSIKQTVKANIIAEFLAQQG